MTGPLFFSEQAILDLHEDLLEAHGGPPGINANLVASVAAFAEQRYYYQLPKPDIPQLAGAYAFAAATFHAFTDGNKRVALALVDLFLMQNGYELTSSDEENEAVILDLARGAIDLEDVMDWVAGNSSPRIE